MHRQNLGILAGLCLLGGLLTADRVHAQTTATARAAATAFRVDTDVYEEGRKEPVMQTLTLFRDGVYYDFAIDESQAVTVIDPLGGRIIMLSPKRQLKTTFDTAQLLAYVSELRQKMAGNKELAKLLSAASQVSEPEPGKLRVGDETLAYEATMQTPKDASMAAQYADFADWSARLNAVLPPNFPPYVRLELNRQIATRQQLPEAIYRITKHNKHTVVYRSQLLAIGLLSTEDVSKVRTVGDLLQTCKEVSKEEFFSAQTAAAPKSTPPGGGVR
jgi:hypothetical protein